MYAFQGAPRIEIDCLFETSPVQTGRSFHVLLSFSRDLDEAEGGLDQGRVKEKEGVDSNPPTPGSSEGHRMSHAIRLSRSMTVSMQADEEHSDEEDAK